MSADKKTTHTPGPWAISGISLEDGSISIAKDRVVIAYATNASSFGDFVNSALKGRKDFGAPDTAVTQFANARLIAAAPDLLEALEYIERYGDLTSGDWSKVRAAIGKATGDECFGPLHRDCDGICRAAGAKATASP